MKVELKKPSQPKNKPAQDKHDKIEHSIENIKTYNKFAERDEYEKEAKSKSKAKMKLQNQFDYYFIVYFRDNDDKNKFCAKHGLHPDFVFCDDLEKIVENK